MSKKYRGKGLINHPSRGRGTCPVCQTKRIKVLYDIITKDGNNLTVCKRCRYKKDA
jgi:C4-type Zn-finger protein